MSTPLLPLDAASCLDPSVAGAKAAALARAARAGLPVLPGFVVPAGRGSSVLEHAMGVLEHRGSGGARLAVLDVALDDGLDRALRDAAAGLAEPLVVRSSSPAEDDHAWSGAFASYLDIRPGELATAVRGVWASTFGVDALGRLEESGQKPGDVFPAVLIQPQLSPTCGGKARLDPSGTVEVHVVDGHPGALLAGWRAGRRIRVDPAGGEAHEPAIRAAAALVRQSSRLLDRNVIEWAWTPDGIVLLQAGREAAAPAAVPAPVPTAGLDDPRAVRLARLARRFPGPAGERFVLGWAAGTELPELPEVAPAMAVAAGGVAAGDIAAALARCAHEATALAAEAWGVAAADVGGVAARAFRDLRAGDVDAALAALGGLRPVPPDRAARLLARLSATVAALRDAGHIRAEWEFWRLEPATISALETGAVPPAGPARHHGPDRWEPFVHAVVRAVGTRIAVPGAVDGIAAGRAVAITDPHHPPVVGPRDILLVEFPRPALSPLLWRAGAVVSAYGDASAHLFEVAGSLGVPALVGADFSALHPDGMTGLADAGALVAVDGAAGELFVLPD